MPSANMSSISELSVSSRGSRKPVTIINRTASDVPHTPPKHRVRLKQGLDYGINLLANCKYSPPGSPDPVEGRMERTSLRLESQGSEDESLDPRMHAFVRKDLEKRRISQPNLLTRIRERRREKSNQSDRDHRNHQSERSERDHRDHRDHRAERSERDHQSERSERDHRDHRDHQSERSERDHRSERSERDHRSERSERDRRDRERSERDRRDRERSERNRRDRERDHRDHRDNRSDISEDLFPHGDPRMPSLHSSAIDVSERSNRHYRHEDKDRMERNINDIIVDDTNSDYKDRRYDEDYHDRRYEDDSLSSRNNLLGSEFDNYEDKPKPSGLSPQEIMKKKRKALLHIKILNMQGYEPFRDVGITNILEDILEVEEEQIERRSLANGIEFQKKLLVGATYIGELLNNKYDPFDLKLDGWSEQVYEDRDEYNEVLEELYYKYSDQMAMAPEVKLLMMLGGSAMMFHFSKSLMNSGNLEVPNFENIMKKYPEIKKAYEQAAMNEMMNKQKPSGDNRNPQNMMSYILGNMTGDPNIGNALNAFMNTGGNPPRPPIARPASAPTAQDRIQTPQDRIQQERNIIPPADPDNILEDPISSNISRRTTRGNRDKFMT